MEPEKILALVKSFGFPAAITVWFLWKIQGFMDALLISQTTMVELMRQLIELHK